MSQKKLYIHTVDGSPVEWKMTLAMVKARLPAVEFTEDTDLSEFGYFTFEITPCPARNELTQDVIEITPLFIYGEWTQQWSVFDLPIDVVSELISEKQQKYFETFSEECVRCIQERLDAFARTRNYDGILSACTYANSKISQFATEGQYCTDARDSTWAAMYSMYAQVQAGTMAPPNSYEEVEELLPSLVWP